MSELLIGEFVNKLVFWIWKATRCFTSEALHAPSQLHRKSCLMRGNLNFFVMNLHHNLCVCLFLACASSSSGYFIKLTCLWKQTRALCVRRIWEWIFTFFSCLSFFLSHAFNNDVRSRDENQSKLKVEILIKRNYWIISY